MKSAFTSDPWNHAGDGVSVEPVDDPGIHVRHPQVVAVLNDHGHSRTGVEEDRIRLGHGGAAGMVNRHPS